MPDVNGAFEAMKVTLDEVARLMRSAPLSPHHRAGLAVMVALYFRTEAALAIVGADGKTGSPAFEKAFAEVGCLTNVAVTRKLDA